jgi:quercetin dioxygenase-like cupin family protein
MAGMENLNRRDLCALLSAFTAMAALPAESKAQSTMAPPPTTEHPILSKSTAFAFAALPVVKNENGESREVIRGDLPTGEAVELHETTLLPGHMPHPPHKHRHSEFMMVREGTLEFDNDGARGRLGPGGVFFAASNVMHGLKNVGATKANYFVLAVGQELGG